MKLTTYTSAVPTVSSNVRANVQTGGQVAQFGNPQWGMKALANGLGQMEQAMYQRFEREDKATMMEAMNAASQSNYDLLYNNENGLLNRQLDAAKGIEKDYVDQSKKNMEDVLRKYNFHSDSYKNATVDLMNSSLAQSLQQVQKHADQQQEKVLDVGLQNNIDDQAKMASMNYKNWEYLKQYGDKVALLVSARYPEEKFGKTMVEERTKAALGVVGKNAINAAMGANDYEQADELIKYYSKSLTAEEINNYQKVTFTKKAAIQVNQQAEKLFKEFGGDLGRIQKALNNGPMADTAKGMEFAASEIGKNYGVNSCANFTTSVLKAMGADNRLYSSLADGMQVNAEKLGLAYSDRSQLRDGDVVFWSLPNSGYKPSNDPGDVFSNEYAYKGTTHVGVYNAKTGKVVQSGTHGVAEIDLDYYKVTGFAHAGGGYSDEDKKKIMQQCISMRDEQKRIERAQADSIVDQYTPQIQQMIDAGTPIAEIKKWALNTAGNDNYLLSHLDSVISVRTQAANNSMAGGGGGGGGETSQTNNSPLFKYGIEKAIGHGFFKNKAELGEYVASRGGNSSTLKAAYGLYDAFIDGTGPYAKPWQSLAREALGDSGAKGTALTNMVASGVAAGKQFYQDYVKKNHEEPDDYRIMKAIVEGSVPRNYGSYVTKPGWLWDSKADLNVSDNDLIRAGIDKIVKRGDGDIYTVYMRDGSVKAASGDDINGMVGR